MCDECVKDGARRFDEDGTPICYLCGHRIEVQTYIDAGHAISHTDCFLDPRPILPAEITRTVRRVSD